MMSGAARSPAAPCERQARRPAVGLDQVVDAGAAAADVRSASSTISMPGIDCSRSRGGCRTPCACARWQASWYATLRVEIGCRGARGAPSSATSSDDVAHPRRERMRASGPRRVVGKQLAIFLHRRPAAGRVDRRPDRRPRVRRPRWSRRAKARASSSRPAWRDSAPQHPCSAGATTSQPSAASTLMVARCTRGNTRRCTQPVRRPTFIRAGPTAGVRSADGRQQRAHDTRGANGEERAQPRGSARATERPSALHDPPTTTSGASSTRMTPGYGSARNNARETAVRRRTAS